MRLYLMVVFLILNIKYCVVIIIIFVLLFGWIVKMNGLIIL